MITYELAKQLKDAGFPQQYKGFMYTHTSDGIDLGYGKRMLEQQIYCPTLSELIEVCGNRFLILKQFVESTGTYWLAGGIDVAAKGRMVQMTDCIKNGAKSPEEAVAKLWLELNKND